MMLASPRGLHSFTLELKLSNSRTHSWLSWVTRWTVELKLSCNRNECKPLASPHLTGCYSYSIKETRVRGTK
jgi:hypothetical protein